MKTQTLIYRILITVGVMLSAPGPGFAQTNGWRQLFNGKDMKGWEQVGPGKFVVEDGKLKTVGGMGMLLYPAEKFGDVVIRVVYTVKDNDCNSGVFIRIPEKPADEWAAVNTGYEVQIDNGVRHVGGEYHCSGVLYSLTKALAHPQRKPGEWNELEITLDGPRTIVMLNGQKVTDYKEGDPVPPKTRDFEPTRGPRPLTGYIGVQNHDALSTAYFKEIAVKRDSHEVGMDQFLILAPKTRLVAARARVSGLIEHGWKEELRNQNQRTIRPLKLMARANWRTAALVAVGVLLTAGAATAVAAQAIANGANTQLPPEVRQQLEKQKAAMRAIYLEFTTTNRGTLTNWDYAPAPALSAYFEGNHFYRQERIPGYEFYDNETAFDGQIIWQRARNEVRKCSLADAPGLMRLRSRMWPYLDAASIHAPAYISELERFSSLEPLALHYLEHGYSTKVEAVGEKLRVTFQAEDESANLQRMEVEQKPGDPPGATTPKGVAAGTEDDKTLKAIKPARTVVLLLDPKHGYGVAEREERNVAGQRTGRIESQDWKFYEGAGIWLPSRCVVSYYARPPLFLTEFSNQPVHTVTIELKRVEFGEKDIPFAFDPTKPGSHIFDRTTSEAPLTNAPPLATQEKVDVATVERIKTEVVQHSQVMEIVSWLTDVYGPRLTGSPNTKAATDWAVATMRSWGLSNVHLEQWGPFDRGWTSEQFAFRAVAPRPFIINAVPSVGSPGTKGRVTGPAIRFDVHSFADMQRYAGKLKGAFLLMDPARPTPAHFEPQARRLSDARLEAMAAAQPSLPASGEIEEIRYHPEDDDRARRWLVNEGGSALLFNASGDGGTIFIWGRGGAVSWKKNDPDQLPWLKVGAESYGRIVRILEKNIPVTLELDMQNTFYDDPNVFNIIAEIPGTDPKLKDEVVMIGAHFDSWTYGTGATDNAAGSAMLMEAMRILKALNLQPRRAIRIALWTGEEQGALGSKAYVTQHFRDVKGDSSTTKPEYETFSVYFNLDGGTGKIRGIFELGATAPGPIFDAWMGPFKEMGMKTVSPWDVGGGDDLEFKRVGLPSFGFIQDPIEYGTRTHHSSADVYERIQPEDLQFNSAVLASFAWHAAQRDEKLPR